MRLETVEHALLAWREWRASIEGARSRLSYAPPPSAVERLAWWEVNNGGALQRECRDALTRLRLPKSFARYWLACFLSDYRHGSHVNPEKIRLSKGLEPIRLPIDPVPPGCWRVHVEFKRYYRGDTQVEDSERAASVRVFPPHLVSVVIPRWAPLQDGALRVEILDVERWREQRHDRKALPLLVQLVPRTRTESFVDGGPNTPHEGWEALAKIEIPPWAISDEVLSLGRQQLIALREWQEGLGLHPMYRCLRRAAAQAKPRGTEVRPPAWPQWLQQYRKRDISYRDLVERVYWFRAEGSLPQPPREQPLKAKRAADWVRKQMKSAAMPAPRLPRNWWAHIEFRGS